jgi:hypothetical protein
MPHHHLQTFTIVGPSKQCAERAPTRMKVGLG